MISPDEGPSLLVDELRYGQKGDVEVILSGKLGTLEEPIALETRGRASGDRLMSRGRPAEIAIIGLGCRFAGASDASTYFENILAGKDCTREVPADRWDPETFCDPRFPRRRSRSDLPRRLSRFTARLRRRRARHHAAHGRRR